MKWLPVVIAIFVASTSSAGPSQFNCTVAYEETRPGKASPDPGSYFERAVGPTPPVSKERLAQLQETKVECIRLAEEGDAEYQDILGHAYYWGDISGHEDRPEASNWFRRAALQGHAGGMFMLGSILIEGRGVLQDYEQGREWLVRAAEHSEGIAAFSLGKIYRDGVGVDPDPIRAHMWLNLAASVGFTAAGRERDALAMGMRPAQVTSAQRLAREWIVSHPGLD